MRRFREHARLLQHQRRFRRGRRRSRFRGRTGRAGGMGFQARGKLGEARDLAPPPFELTDQRRQYGD
jgi:hypothetical protein